MIYLTGRTASQ